MFANILLLCFQYFYNILIPSFFNFVIFILYFFLFLESHLRKRKIEKKSCLPSPIGKKKKISINLGNLILGLDDGQHMSVYGHRSSSSTSSSPPVAAAASSGNGMLVVPQPVKGSQQVNGSSSTSSGRKYQCKMCPQVTRFLI